MVPLAITIVVDRETGGLGMVSTAGANGDIAGDLDTILAVLPQVQASLMKNRLQAERDLVQATAVEAKPSKKRQPVTAQEGGAGTGG